MDRSTSAIALVVTVVLGIFAFLEMVVAGNLAPGGEGDIGDPAATIQVWVALSAVACAFVCLAVGIASVATGRLQRVVIGLNVALVALVVAWPIAAGSGNA